MKKKIIILSAICLMILCIIILCFSCKKKGGSNGEGQENSVQMSDSSSVEGDADPSVTAGPAQSGSQDASVKDGQNDPDPTSDPSASGSEATDPDQKDSEPGVTSTSPTQPEKVETEPGEIQIDAAPSSGKNAEEKGESDSTSEPVKEPQTSTSEENPEPTKKQTLYTGNVAGEEDTSF